MNKEILFKGWADLLIETNDSKSWLKLQMKKTWKKRFLILYCLAGTSENPRVGSYNKEENLIALGEPDKSIILHPQYRLNKLHDYNGKYYVLEINNNKEKWCISSEESSEIVDKWATWIQSQTKLSRTITTCLYLVDGASTENMKRIFASSQKCILHLNKWGIILALQKCRSVIAMWPIKTIRNFECGNNNEFSIEAGKRAPMGEGHFTFHTAQGQQDQIFKTLDRFIVSALNKKAALSPNNKLPDIDYNEAYEKLHQSAHGTGIDITANHDFLRLNPPTHLALNTGFSCTQERPEYAYIEDSGNHSNESTQDQRTEPQDEYNYIEDESFRRKNLMPPIRSPETQPLAVQNEVYFNKDVPVDCNLYDELNHHKNVTRTISDNYNNINESNICGNSLVISTYDKLDFSKSDLKPNSSIEDGSPKLSEMHDNILKRDLSRSSLLSQHSMQEIADHFIYQVPSSLSNINCEPDSLHKEENTS